MPDPDELTSTFGQRVKFYAIHIIYLHGCKIARTAIPSLVPLLGASRGWTEAQQAMVNGGFYSGYILTQIPSAPLIQRFGAKPVLGVGIAGTAAVFLAVPRLSSAGAVTTAMAVMGLLQGPLGPGSSAMNAEWMPRGSIEQTWALRAIALSHTLSPLFSVWLVPRLVRFTSNPPVFV